MLLASRQWTRPFRTRGAVMKIDAGVLFVWTKRWPSTCQKEKHEWFRDTCVDNYRFREISPVSWLADKGLIIKMVCVNDCLTVYTHRNTQGFEWCLFFDMVLSLFITICHLSVNPLCFFFIKGLFMQIISCHFSHFVTMLSLSVWIMHGSFWWKGPFKHMWGQSFKMLRLCRWVEKRP